jgi:hypothetical protein
MSNIAAMDPERRIWQREELAQFILARRDRIRGLVRRRIGQQTRRFEDSEDIFSSVMRRADRLLAEGRLRPCDERELWGLIERIALNNSIDKNRLMQRLARIRSEDGDYASVLQQRVAACRSDEETQDLILRVALWLTDDEQELWFVRLRGGSHQLSAARFRISVEAVRQRWSALLRRITDRIAQGGLNGHQ